MLNRKAFLRNSLFASGAILLDTKVKGLHDIFYRPFLQNVNVSYYVKTDAPYNTLRRGFNLRIYCYPKIIAVVNNINGVVEALAYAQKNKLQVTVKSGGHCMEGFSCLENGLVINLEKLNRIDLSENGFTTIQSAARLKQIYETILPKALYLPGGSCQSVAIGGLTLGGGYGLLSRKFGLTCDSLVEATMVSGDGKIVHTKNNADLLWALRGGNNGNFGVVTDLKFKLSAAPKTMKSYKFRNQNTTIAKAIQICEAWFQEVVRLPNGCFSAFIFNGNTTYILLTNVDKPNVAVNNFVSIFTKLSTKITQTGDVPLAKALSYYYGQDKPLMFKNASAGLYDNFAEIKPVITDVFNLIKQKPGMLYQVNTLGGTVQNPFAASQAAFPHRNKLYFSELQAYWSSPAQETGFLNQFQNIQTLFSSAGVTAQYRNYPDVNFTDFKTKYYGSSLSKLMEIKKTYDPNNIFGGAQTL